MQPADHALALELKRATQAARLRALGLVAPLALFLTVFFAAPIGDMLIRGIWNPTVADTLPRTVAALADWDGSATPPDAIYAALADDLAMARADGTLGRAATRLNQEQPGFRSLLIDTGRALARADVPATAATFAAIDPRWAKPETFVIIAGAGSPLTARFYLSALDRDVAPDGTIVAAPEEERIYLMLLARTLWISALVTVLCLLLGYPVAYVLAHLPPATANLLMICVLLPFWTSLLVRTTAWIALLQTNGVINDVLVATPFFGEDDRLQLIHNQTGTVIAMTHILLPFTILPLYSVMRGINPATVRAARSLGADGFTAFRRVYFPQSLPGIAAGAILVFILAMGYYITPALVGGRTGQLLSNMIAFHMQSSLNWGLAAALAGVLLACVLMLYFLFNRLIGAERIKFG